MSNQQKYPKRGSRAQCIVHRGTSLLMVKMKLPKEDREFWLLPGGGIEEGETPEEAAVRELKEECNLEGTIVRKLQTLDSSDTSSVYNYFHTFLMDIGDQEPSLGSDPDAPQQILFEVRWRTVSELSERDRASVISSGLLAVQEFREEYLKW